MYTSLIGLYTPVASNKIFIIVLKKVTVKLECSF